MTGIVERVRRVLAPRQVKAPAQGKVIFWPKWVEGQAQWQMTDLSAYIEEGFEMNAVIYAAIMFKVRAAYAAVLRGYEGTRDEPVLLDYGHELSLICERPNHYQSFAELQAEMLVYFNLMGNAYVWFRRQAGREYPLSFYCLRPDWVHHIYDGQELRGYVYAPKGIAIADGTPLLPEDVMHVRLPNPGDQYAGMGKGLSPIAPLARSADVDNIATAWLKLFFDEGAMPRGLLSVDAPLNEQIIEEATERWTESYGGNANWLKPLILGNGAAYQKIGQTFAELDVSRLDARNESRIVMPFGVPLTLIESRPDLAQATYSNKQQDYKMFLETTLLPELDMFQQEWRYYLRSDDGREFAQYDLARVPGYVDKEARLLSLAAAWEAGAATRREYRTALGLPAGDTDDVYKVPTLSAMLVPAFAPSVAPQSEVGSESSTEDAADKALGALWMAPEQKAAIWRVIDTKARSWERDAARAAGSCFETDRREILAIINAGQKDAYAEAKSIAWSLMLFKVVDYLMTAGSGNWRKVFAPILAAVVVDQGEQLNALFGMSFDVRNLLAEDWFRSYTMTFADPITATSNDTLHRMFERAMADGWSVPQMQTAINGVFDQWISGNADPEDLAFALDRLPPHRRELIARTETMRASNAGAQALYKKWGVRKKEWLTSLDGRERPSHHDANGQVVAIDEPFIVGGSQMMQPGDQNAPIGEVANCRCTVLPVMEGI
jgi:HK97 family phage portal protein